MGHGTGHAKSDHFEAKIRQAWDVGSLTLGWIYNNRKDYDVQSYNSDGSVSWDLHERITGNPEVDAEHYSEWQNGRRDSLLSLHGDFLFNDAIGFTFTGYYENKHGYGVGGTAKHRHQFIQRCHQPARRGVPISPSTTPRSSMPTATSPASVR